MLDILFTDAHLGSTVNQIAAQVTRYMQTNSLIMNGGDAHTATQEYSDGPWKVDSLLRELCSLHRRASLL